MRERVVAYKDDEYDVELTVRQVTLAQGFHRYSLHSREQARLKEREEPASILVQWAATRSLPDCLSSTEIKNLDKEKAQLANDMSLDEFLALPEALVVLWEQAVYECNPHWWPMPKKEEEQGEAKEPEDNSNLTNGSSSGSSGKNQKKNPPGTSTT